MLSKILFVVTGFYSIFRCKIPYLTFLDLKVKKTVYLPWIVCGIGALFYCYEYLLRILPSVMAQDLMQAFNIDAFALGNLSAFYYYAYTPMQLPVGIMMDRYGPKRLLIFATLICALGSYLFATYILSIAQLGRFLMGLGSAFGFVGVLKLATLWLPPNRFAFMVGLATSLAMIGAMGGDILLGDLVGIIGWRFTIYLGVIAGFIVLLLIWKIIPADNHKFATHTSLMSYQQLLMEVLQLFKNPQIWLVGIVGCLLYLPLSAFAELWGIPYLQSAYNMTPAIGAETVSVVFLGWAIGAPLIGLIADYYTNKRTLIIINASLAIVIFCIILYIPQTAGLWLKPLLFLFGIFTSAEIIIFAMILDITSRRLTGTAIALTNMMVMLGGVLFQPLLGWFLDYLSGENIKGSLTAYSAADFRHAMLIIPVALLLANFLLLFYKVKLSNSEHSTGINSSFLYKQ